METLNFNLEYSKLKLLVTIIAITSLHVTMAATVSVITEDPSTEVASLNSNVTFTCRGYQFILWKIDALIIRSRAAQMAMNAAKIFPTIDDQNSSQLVMLASLQNNNTRIQCFIRAERYQVQSSESEVAYLYVYGLPLVPTNLMILWQSGLDLSLSWEAPFSLEGENISYIVEVTNTRSRESRQLESDSSQLVFNESFGERDCSLYEFRVHSVNPFGRSNTYISDTIRIPTKPLILQSADVFVNVSMVNGLFVTLSFNAPMPCTTYQVTSYNVTFTEWIDSTMIELDSSTAFSVQSETYFDFVLLVFDHQTTSIRNDKVYHVEVEARNAAGSTISQPMVVYTTGLQSSSVVLEVNNTASVTCTFAVGSDALGCEVSFYDSSSMELMMAQNITREPTSNTVTKNTPLTGRLEGRNASNITVLTAEWKSNGSISPIHVQPQVVVVPAEDMTTTAPVTVYTQTTEEMSSYSESAVLQPCPSKFNGSLYTIIGAILGSVVLLLLTAATVVVFGTIVFVMRKRRGSVLTGDASGWKSDANIYDDARTSSINSGGSNSSPLSERDPNYSVIAEPRSGKLCDDSYVLMQSSAQIGKKQFMATNPLYCEGAERDNKAPAYEEIKLTAKMKGDSKSPAQGAPVIYDEVKIDPDGVKLRGNESYGTANTN